MRTYYVCGQVEGTSEFAPIKRTPYSRVCSYLRSENVKKIV